MSILRRWFWVIGLFGMAGGALALAFAVTTSLGKGSSYHTSTTMGVSRVLSYGGSVASASSAGEDGETAAAALALVDWAKTPQFLSKVDAELRKGGFQVPQLEIYNKVSISSDRSPGTIVINSSSSDPRKAQKLVETAAQVVRDRARADEDKVRIGIDSNLASLMESIQSRLIEIYASLNQKARAPGDAALRFAMVQFLTRGTPGSSMEEFAAIVRDLAAATSDPSMVVLLAQSQALEAELGQVSTDRERLGVDLKRWDEPVIVVSAAETVESPAVSRLRLRDLVAMGGIAGAVVGWAVANLLERWRPAKASSSRVEAPPPGREHPEWEMTV